MKVTNRIGEFVWTTLIAFAVMTVVLTPELAFGQDDEPVELKVGDAAPAFELMGSDGKTYSLEQFRGKKEVVLAFFPKAFTPG